MNVYVGMHTYMYIINRYNEAVQINAGSTFIADYSKYGGGHGNLIQYSCLENPMDRGAWRGAVRGVAKSWTRLM